MQIYSIPFCPFCFRVKLTVKEKEISATALSFTEIDLQKPPQSFMLINPNKTVPTLEVDTNLGFAESLVLMDYLDEKFPNTYKIFGKSIEEKAQNKYLIERIGNEVTQILMSCFFTIQSKVKFTQALEKLPLAFKNLDNLLSEDQIYFGGNKLNAVDISFAPFFCYYYIAKKYNEKLILPAKETKSFKYFENLINNSNIKNIILNNEKFEHHIKELLFDKEEIRKIKNSSRNLIQNLDSAIEQLNNNIKRPDHKQIIWTLSSNEYGPYISTKFKFAHYKQALTALDILCDLQETSDHHTNFSLDNFSELKVEICTHQPKWGVTEMDLAFAEVLSHKI